jgi:ABC-type Mn2+/Zn2+ transport system permease subunit
MITEFLHSWELFHNTYLAGWCIGLFLSLVGILAVARDQIFLTAASAQAATFGVALGLWLSGLAADWPGLHSDSFLSGLAMVFAVLAVLFTVRGRQAGGESIEAITGWIFLLSASGSVLLLSHSPHGLEEIHQLLSSSLIGASATEIGIFASLTALTSVVLLRFHRPIVLVTLDPLLAQAIGLKTHRWMASVAIALGLATGLSIRSAGLLYTFGCLVLPALVAKNLCREIRTMFIMAPCVVLGSGLVGFILANHYDLPPAQMTVALLCVLLLIAWALRARIRWYTAR